MFSDITGDRPDSVFPLRQDLKDWAEKQAFLQHTLGPCILIKGEGKPSITAYGQIKTHGAHSDRKKAKTLGIRSEPASGLYMSPRPQLPFSLYMSNKQVEIDISKTKWEWKAVGKD